MSEERISLENKSLARGYSSHIQRYTFATWYSSQLSIRLHHSADSDISLSLASRCHLGRLPQVNVLYEDE